MSAPPIPEGPPARPSLQASSLANISKFASSPSLPRSTIPTSSNEKALEYYLNGLAMAITEAPPLLSYAEATGHVTEAGMDVWVNQSGMRLSEVVPCLPPQYGAGCRDGRALYVLGVPHSWQLPAFKAIFNGYGAVDKCPTIIDLKSEDTFRWVIMKTAIESEKVLGIVNGMQFQDRTLHVCKAIPPGGNVTLGDEFKLEHFFRKDDLAASKASKNHGHPQQEEPKSLPGRKSPILPEQSTILRGEPEDLTTIIPEVTSKEFKTQAVSWAIIAGTMSPKSRTIDLHPENKPGPVAPRFQPIGRIPSISSTQNIESMVEKMRIVFLLNLPQTMTLQDISNAIQEGPLMSIRFGVDANNGKRYAGVIFQYARDAEAFYQVLYKERVDSRPYRFRFIADVVRGEGFPADETIKAMGPPTFASRRLTIVKSRFFFIFGERHLRNLCEKAVGAENIQLIWLYNGGNATVVFAEVAAAIKVKKMLDKMRDDAEEKGSATQVWDGLQTTFSKDPCVQPLELKTAMHD